MSYDTFRHTPIYENALRAPSVLERPSSPLVGSFVSAASQISIIR